MSLLSKAGAAALALAAAVVVLDQAVKHWILDTLHLPELASVPVVGPLRLTMVWNEGVSFGLLRADTAVGRWALVAVAAAVVAWLIWWVRKADRPLFAAAVGLVIGGALGNNLIDRARIGRVVDFLDFSGLYFPWVFNVADSAITVGVVLLLLDNVLAARRERSPRDP